MPVDSMAAVESPAARPRFVTAGDRPLFTWHHPPPPHLRRGAGIVLCPALGYEYMSSYRAWRMLAERLAAIGFDTLRLDYDGTGNSAGNPDDPGRVGAWLRSIDRAIAETRRLSGSSPIALIGLRAGALLALQAAAAGGVERLVLWSPFSSGRAYVRELKAIARLSGQDEPHGGEDESSINAEGHIVTAETMESLARWTLDDIAVPPAHDVLLVDRDDRPAEQLVDARLQALGSTVTRIRARGTAEMLLPPHLAKVPEDTLDEIASWLRPWHASDAPPPARPAIQDDLDSARAVRDAYSERAVRFGPDRRLFGILACPARASSMAPAIVLLNTGGGHHVGPHRLYVSLAREWAAGGHLVLRFDLGGLGDSVPPCSGRRSDSVAYPDHMLDDAREAIALVRQEAPNRRVILAGLCSGGWLAYRAASQGLAVDAIASINPPLYLRDGNPQWLRRERTLERYQQSMRDPSRWAKALRGDVSYTTFTRAAASVLARHFAIRVSGALGDPLPDGLAKDLCTIAGRGINSLFVFSRGDDGLAYFQLHAQPALRRPDVRERVRHMVVEETGHAFRPRAAQQTLRRILIDFVRSETGGGD
jgi:alpha-beta hydrolase superfamily lysophospholipase